MATDLTVRPENRPGVLARIGQLLGRAGVNIDGFCAVTSGDSGEVHVLVEDAAAARAALEAAGMRVTAEQEVLLVPAEDRPGALGEITRKLADAEVNIGLAYLATATRVVIGTDDLEAARTALQAG